MPKYKSKYTGPQIDSGVSRALPGGEVDQLRHNRNLLDNWDFRNPVNQRGQTTYPNVTQARYTIDRWTAISWYVLTEIKDGYVEFTEVSGGLQPSAQVAKQLFETPLPSTMYTLSIMLSDGTIKYATGSISSGVGLAVSGTDWACVAEQTSVHIDVNSAKSVSVSAVKLELGSVSTLANDPPADYGIELLKCQRYFQTFKTQPLRPTDYRDFRPIMRTNPVLSTITVGADTLYTASADL